jgi:uncharacterized membrane protein
VNDLCKGSVGTTAGIAHGLSLCRRLRCQKKVAEQSKKIYIVRVVFITMKFDKILLIGGIIVAAGLALKSIKQFIYLSFTLLTLKFVWILIIVLFILMSLKKKTRSSGEIKK